MENAGVTRKLAVILAADVVGYSRLMGLNEAATLAAMKAHRRELVDPKIAEHHGRTPAQVVFRFALDVGMIPLTGTTSTDHMRDDLAVLDFQLAQEDVAVIERLGTGRVH